MLDYKVHNKIKSAALEDVKVEGFYGDLIDLFFDSRIMSSHGRDEVYQETEDAFKYQRDDAKGVGIWQGEYWGKWIISAVRAARYNGSSELREFIRRGAKNLIKYQRPDGYLGTYKDSSLLLPCTIEEGIAKLGYAVEWNWNIWCRKYTLWGMMEAYGLLGDKELLDSAIGMADYLIDELDRLGLEPGDTGTFKGLPSCSIMKPMLILYRNTGDEKYLNFCKKIADRWERPEVMPGLIANALSDMRIREWYPDSNKWAKAYEMMSCYDGVIELYRVTGEEKYFLAVSRFFDMIVKHERNILSSVAFNDVFGDAAYDLNCMTEPCDVIHFMRLAHELFALTGERKYMDVFESAAYNALFTSVCKDGTWGARALRTAGRHMIALGQANMTHSHCCVNNMPRGLLNFAESVIMTDGDSLIVNLYTDFSGSITVGERRVNVKIGGSYLADGRAEISISGFEDELAVKLRIPEWCRSYRVLVDGASFSSENEYLDITVTSGANITAEFDAPVVITDVVSDPELGDLPWEERRWISDVANVTPESAYTSADPAQYIRNRASVIHKGVLLLCRTKLIGSTEEEMFAPLALTPDYKCIACEKVDSPEGIYLAFRLTFSNGENTLEYTVCDYSSGTNIMTLDKHFFSVYF